MHQKSGVVTVRSFLQTVFAQSALCERRQTEEFTFWSFQKTNSRLGSNTNNTSSAERNF